jgi:hypothetical protein
MKSLFFRYKQRKPVISWSVAKNVGSYYIKFAVNSSVEILFKFFNSVQFAQVLILLKERSKFDRF